MPSLLFVTRNSHKFEEAQAILGPAGIKLEQYPHRPLEPQSDSLEEIAQHGCQQVRQEVTQPIFVEDAGMFIQHFKGFPGPYSSYALRTLGNPGILKLMKGVEKRTAIFQSAIAFAVPNKTCVIFKGDTLGSIANSIRGTHWGFDPIFIPTEGDGSTYAEMPLEMKNQLSHRAKALKQLLNYLRSHKLP